MIYELLGIEGTEDAELAPRPTDARLAELTRTASTAFERSDKAVAARRTRPLTLCAAALEIDSRSSAPSSTTARVDVSAFTSLQNENGARQVSVDLVGLRVVDVFGANDPGAGMGELDVAGL